ncbi:MAG: phosphotransferase [Dehalococcoidia bacterium]
MPVRFPSPAPLHTAAVVRAWLRRELGSEVRSLTRVDLGVVNIVYAARLADDLECFVKVAPQARGVHRLREEVWAFEQCRTVGVPTPEVLAFDPAPTAFPEAFHVTRRISGENGLQAGLSHAGRLAALRQLGHYLARIHAIRLTGFGVLQPTENGYMGQYPTLWENWASLLDSAYWWEQLLRDRLVTEDQIDAIRRHFAEHRDLFNVEQSCLVYADGGLKNLVVQGETVVGLVDMENVVAAEPVNDFDALHYGSENEFAAVCEGAGGAMSNPAVAEIHAPAAERIQLNAVRELVGNSPGGVRVRVGLEDVELPRSLVRVLLAAATSLRDGDTVAIVSEEAEVSPAQAARLLGVSRQYVDRLLAADLLPSRRLPHSSYRKIPARAVLEYKQSRARKREGIRTIINDATASGLAY